VINYVNAFVPLVGSHVPALGTVLPNGQVVGYGSPFGYLDVNGDDFVFPNDALEVINIINANPEGEGEASQVPATLHTQPFSSDLLALLALDIASQPKRRHG